MTNLNDEWVKEAEFEMDTAEYMVEGEKYLYAIFICHLSLEKALKGLYKRKFKKEPPKTHHIMYLVNKLELKLPEKIETFLSKIDAFCISTKYPQKLNEIEDILKNLLSMSKETLEWIERKF